MSVSRWIITAGHIFSISMVLLSLVEINSSQTHSYNPRIFASTSKPQNLSSTVTNLFVNSQIFSVDYDMLKDSKSLQHALLIVDYEPQKIGAKEIKNISKSILPLEKKTQTSYVTTKLPIDRNYYDGLPKQLFFDEYIKQKNKSTTAKIRNLIQENLPPKRSYGKVLKNPQQQETDYHSNNSTIGAHPLRYFTMKNKEVFTTLSPLKNQTLSVHTVNASCNPSLSLNHKKKQSDQSGSGTSKTEIDISAITKKQHKYNSNQPIGNKNVYQLLKTSISNAATNDKIRVPNIEEQIIFNQPTIAKHNKNKSINKTIKNSEILSTIPVELESISRLIQPIQQSNIYSFTKMPHSTISSIPRKIHSFITKRRQALNKTNNPFVQESVLTYQAIPRRYKTIGQNVTTDQTKIHLVEPTQEDIKHPILLSKERVFPEEQNFGHPTVIKPIYNLKKTNLSRETKYNLLKQKNNVDNDYFNNNSHENNNSNKNDNNSSKNYYDYNYIKRYEEPINDEQKSFSQHRETKEDPDYDQDQTQYIDSRLTEEDSNYDHTRGQNTQHNKATVYEIHNSKCNGENFTEEATEHDKPKSHNKMEEYSDDDHESEYQIRGKKGDKGYKLFHEHDKSAKGYHNKEGHYHHYDEKEGENKKHHEETGFHEEHEKGEKGEKKSAFKEKEDHKKGHSTKGQHVIHKKDEFEKKTEFFDEFHEGGDIDKDGSYHEDHHYKKGGHYKKKQISRK